LTTVICIDFLLHYFIFYVVNVQAAPFQQFYIVLIVNQPGWETCK